MKKANSFLLKEEKDQEKVNASCFLIGYFPNPDMM